MAAPEANNKQRLRFVDLYGISTQQRSTPSFHRHWNPLAHVTEIAYLVVFTFHRQLWPFGLFTWAEIVEVVVSPIRQVPGEGAGVNFGWGGGVGAQRKPPLEQILLLHPDLLLVLCRGRSADGRKEGREDLERKQRNGRQKILIRTKRYKIFACMHLFI